MTTKEIIQLLPKNEIVKKIIPSWAYRTIPFPFYRNGVPCLGFYFYPMNHKDGKHHILAPIIQLIASYPSGHIVGITASPFFLSDRKDAELVLGEYPNTTLKGLSLEASNALYDKYYASCDAFFESKQQDEWSRCFSAVKEEGMDRFFALFSGEQKPCGGGTIERIPAPEVFNSDQASNGAASISAKTRHVLRDIQDFLKAPAFVKEAKEVAQAIAESNRSEYTVAVIGEFSRGKSTFLNSLLGFDCLPIGDLPTTAVLTKIYNGTTATATFIDRSRKSTSFELSRDNMERFLADDQGNDPEGVLQITTPMEWLQKSRIVFFDTPGAGDVVGKRADIVRSAINYCDSSIMAISAQAPCSLTELEFLKENVIIKAVPRCSILITKLDTVPEAERMQVVNHIKNKISSIIQNAEFWVANEMSGIETGSLDAYGIEAIRSRIIQQSSSDEEAGRLRKRQLLARVKHILEEASAEIRLIEEAEKLSDEEKLHAIRKLEYNKEHLSLIKDELSVKCEEMQYAAEKEILSELEECEKSILADCNMSLQKTLTPKEWVEKDFPYMIERAMKPILGRLEKKIIFLVSTSKTDLGNAAKEKLSCQGITVVLPSFEAIKLNPTMDFTPENIEKTRLISRCATLIATPIALGFIGPFAMLVSGGLGLGAEMYLKKKIEDQKNLIGEQVKNSLGNMFTEIRKHLHDYILKCYSELMSGINTESTKAINTAIAKIEAASKDRDDSPRESMRLRENLNALIGKITL